MIFSFARVSLILAIVKTSTQAMSTRMNTPNCGASLNNQAELISLYYAPKLWGKYINGFKLPGFLPPQYSVSRLCVSEQGHITVCLQPVDPKRGHIEGRNSPLPGNSSSDSSYRRHASSRSIAPLRTAVTSAALRRATRRLVRRGGKSIWAVLTCGND